MRHIPAEAFSTLVGAIYDCALDPDLWPGTLTGLCDALAFRVSNLALQEMPSGRLLVEVSTGIAPADLERMRGFGPEVVEQWAASSG